MVPTLLPTVTEPAGRPVAAPPTLGSSACASPCFTREYPPDVYGGAGVHVDFLARQLRKPRRPRRPLHGRRARRARSPFAEQDPRFPQRERRPARPLDRPRDDRRAPTAPTLAHSHTWYANMAGHWTKLLYDVPHVVTAHSLEPQRPWKAEQLGGGYRLSSWAEQTAYLRRRRRRRGQPRDGRRHPGRLPRGVDPSRDACDLQRHRRRLLPARPGTTSSIESLGVDLSRPYVTFVGRITRQKGVPHLLRAASSFDPSCRSCCSPARPTPPS